MLNSIYYSYYIIIIGQGRYGSVWQGSMGDQDVAVKIYPSHYRNYFQNERDTYCLPFMEHPSLLSYYGWHFFNLKRIIQKQ